MRVDNTSHRAVTKPGQRGQAIVEGALVLLLFAGILIGILDLAQMLFVHQAFEERARNAVRYAAVRTFDADAAKNMVLYNQPTAPVGQSGYLGLTSSMVQVTRQGAASTNDDRIVLTISNYPYEFFSFYIAGRATGKPIQVSIPFEAE
jgi:hypothetical protein